MIFYLKYKNNKKCLNLYKSCPNLFNPLITKDELSHPGNLTFSCSRTFRRVPRRVATHALPCVILSVLITKKQ